MAYQETSVICLKCGGACFKPNDPIGTQKAVLEKFGTIANKCVNDCNGKVNCPFAKK